MSTSAAARTVLVTLAAMMFACGANGAPDTPVSQTAASSTTPVGVSLTSTTTAPGDTGGSSLSAEATIVGADVVIEVAAVGFEIRYVEGDVSGETAHVHAYVDRPPPQPGDNVPLGDPTIVHSVGSTITVRGLDPGEHQIWVVAADGNDDALMPPDPVELTVTVP